MRVFAMARPSRSAMEGQLLALAAADLRLTGSKRQRAQVLADEVAALALASVREAPDDLASLFELTGAALRSQALHSLATDPAIDTAALARAEALRQFEVMGLRHLPPAECARADDELRTAISARLFERYRRGLK